MENIIEIYDKRGVRQARYASTVAPVIGDRIQLSGGVFEVTERIFVVFTSHQEVVLTVKKTK